jgi:hypothetical protein
LVEKRARIIGEQKQLQLAKEGGGGGDDDDDEWNGMEWRGKWKLTLETARNKKGRGREEVEGGGE